jgi:hypothetical protein
MDQTVDSAIHASDEVLQGNKLPEGPTFRSSPTSPAPSINVNSHPPELQYTPAHLSEPLATPPPEVEPPPSKPPILTPGQCARILQQRCPACFSGQSFGRSFEQYVATRSLAALILTLPQRRGLPCCYRWQLTPSPSHRRWRRT